MHCFDLLLFFMRLYAFIAAVDFEFEAAKTPLTPHPPPLFSSLMVMGKGHIKGTTNTSSFFRYFTS